uniref:Cytochrome P450 86A2 n=1 Tax=Aegilops tauschii TaxID=37682 RepID=N1R2N5_AEGTA
MAGRAFVNAAVRAMQEYVRASDLALAAAVLFACNAATTRLKSRGGPMLWPVFGIIPTLFAHLDNIYDWGAAALARSGGTFPYRGMWGGGSSGVITSVPANVEHVLKTNFSNYPKGPYYRERFVELLGDGIFNADGEAWRAQRRAATAEMHSAQFLEFSARTIEQLVHGRLIPLLQQQQSQGGVTVDLQEVLLRFTFDNICAAAFGVDAGCLADGLPDEALQDDVLPDGTAIRARQRVIYNTYAIGRDPAAWGEDCLEVRPERWMKGGDFAGGAESPFKYVVFNAGPRLCVGKRFAYTQMKTLAAAVLETFAVEVAPGQAGGDFAGGAESPFKYVVFNAGPRLCVGKRFAYTQMKTLAAAVLETFAVEVAPGQAVKPKLNTTLYMKNGLMHRRVVHGAQEQVGTEGASQPHTSQEQLLFPRVRAQRGPQIHPQNGPWTHRGDAFLMTGVDGSASPGDMEITHMLITLSWPVVQEIRGKLQEVL